MTLWPDVPKLPVWPRPRYTYIYIYVHVHDIDIDGIAANQRRLDTASVQEGLYIWEIVWEILCVVYRIFLLVLKHIRSFERYPMGLGCEMSFFSAKLVVLRGP